MEIKSGVPARCRTITSYTAGSPPVASCSMYSSSNEPNIHGRRRAARRSDSDRDQVRDRFVKRGLRFPQIRAIVSERASHGIILPSKPGSKFQFSVAMICLNLKGF